MEGWKIALAVVMAIGTAVILLGAFVDREKNRRAERALHEPPPGQVPGLAEGPAPSYLTEPEIRAAARDTTAELSPSRRDALRGLIGNSPALPAELDSPTYITDPTSGWAVATDALVLVCAEEITDFRELIPALQRAITRRRPLVVVFSAADPVVRRTLEANQLHHSLQLVAVRTPAANLAEIAAAASASPLDRTDLRAGHCPPAALGRAACWVSSTTHSWVLEESTSPEG